MNDIPKDLYYSESHEWLRLESDGTITLGITDHAQESMGDMVYIDLPELGQKLAAKDECGVLESVKSASDFYLPIAGEIIAVNQELADSPELVNRDPYGKGWLVRLRATNLDDIKTLLNADAYRKHLGA